MAARVRSYNFYGRTSRSVNLTGGKAIVIQTVNPDTSNDVTAVGLAGSAVPRIYRSSLQYQVCSVFFKNYDATGSATMTFAGTGTDSRQYVTIVNAPLNHIKSIHDYDYTTYSTYVWATIAASLTRAGDFCLGFGRGTKGNSPYWVYPTWMPTWSVAHGLMVEDGRHEYMMFFKKSTGTQERVGGKIDYGSLCALNSVFREIAQDPEEPEPEEEEIKRVRWFI